MSGIDALGERALGELADEAAHAVVPGDVVHVTSATAVITGSAFLFLLSNPSAKRRYLVELAPYEA
jgi:hypothetical protein